MIVLKDGSLSSVWEEYDSLRHEQKENQKQQNWGERRQHFQWVNPIRYSYGPSTKKSIDIHVVVCKEQWEAVDSDTVEIVTVENQHAWISSRPLSRLNVHTHCNLGARYRWGIEGAFLVEKHQGYAYEHAQRRAVECHEGLPLPHAPGAPVQHPGPFFQGTRRVVLGTWGARGDRFYPKYPHRPMA